MVGAARGLLAAAILLLVSGVAAQALELTSTDFANGARLPLAQVNDRCGGENRSPALAWSGVPNGTRSFALTLFDPDAGGGRGFWHWLVFDIPAGSTGLREGAGSGTGLPAEAVQSANDFGKAAYGGACPPTGSGPHHYVFTLYALGTPNLSPGQQTRDGALAALLKSHALATATLTGVYER
jgi:hypothetical protein